MRPPAAISEGPDHANQVVGADARCRGRVDRCQPRVQRRSAGALGLRLQARPQGRVAPRGLHHSVKQRAEVQAGAADDERQPPARGDLADRPVGERCPAHRVHPLPWLRQVEQVVRHGRAFLCRGLRRADVEPAIDLLGIRRDDLGPDPRGHLDREPRLARGGGAGEDGDGDGGGLGHAAPAPRRLPRGTAPRARTGRRTTPPASAGPSTWPDRSPLPRNRGRPRSGRRRARPA